MIDDTSGGIAPGPADPDGALAPDALDQTSNGPAGVPAWSPLAPPVTAPAPPPPSPPASGWAVAPPAPVVREVAPGLVFASTWRRLAAWLIDWIIALLLTGLVEVPVAAAIRPRSEVGIALTLAVVALAYLVFGGYFVLGWRSRARGTPGMRMLKLQIGNAFDGRTLTVGQAIRRWVSTGYPLYLLTPVPMIADLASLGSLGLGIVLLISTIGSSTKQGLHDRLANSAMVEPTGQGAGSGGAIAAIAVAVGLFLLIPIVAIVALLFLGSQVSKILSTVGSPGP